MLELSVELKICTPLLKMAVDFNCWKAIEVVKKKKFPINLCLLSPVMLLTPATTDPPTTYTYFFLLSYFFYFYRYLLGCKLSVLTSGTKNKIKSIVVKCAKNISFDKGAERVMIACMA